MTRRILAVLTLSAASVLAGAGPARASGEVWRTPAAATPFTGPATVDAGRTELDSLAAGLRSKERRSAESVPELRATVVGPDGRPAGGVDVLVTVRGSRKEERRTWEGATGPDGRFWFRPAPVKAATKVALDFTWDGGNKIVRVELTPKNGSWRLDEAPYRNAVTGDQEGSCRNLFGVTSSGRRSDGVEMVSVALRLPVTLLECEKVEYGVDRKSDELARVDQIGHRDVNDGDRNFFGRSEEEKMGLEASSELDKELEIIDDPVLQRYVQGVLDRVVAASDDPGMQTHLRIVNTKDVNAFVTAGGNVYVFTGLIAAARNESQLAGVLAHETSHAIARHVTEGATRQMKTQVGTLIGAMALGKLAGLNSSDQQTLVQGSMVGAGLAGMKYDRRAESEADLLGAQYLWRAGWDPEAIARFFEQLESTSGSSPPAWLSTHPSHEKRVANGLHWARAFLPPRDRYLVDTQEFRDAQARVRMLPPPRKKAAEAAGQSLDARLSATPAYQAVIGRAVADVLSGKR